MLDKHLEGRSFIVGSGYTIADISAWGWIDRAGFAARQRRSARRLPEHQALVPLDQQSAGGGQGASRGQQPRFKKEVDEETRRALFPSNYPPAAA